MRRIIRVTLLLWILLIMTMPVFGQTVGAITQVPGGGTSPFCGGDSIKIELSNSGWGSTVSVALESQGNTVASTKVNDSLFLQIPTTGLTTGSAIKVYVIKGAATFVDSSKTITITALDDADFTYAGLICQNTGNADPTVVGSNGDWTFSPYHVGSMNTGSGRINTNAITAPFMGTPITITHITTGTCPDTVSNSVTVTAEDDPSFTYPFHAYCMNSTPLPLPTPVTPGGTFTSLHADIVIPNSVTGEIDLPNCTPRTNTARDVQYTTSGTCPATSTFWIKIRDFRDAYFVYPNPTECKPSVGTLHIDPDSFTTNTLDGNWTYTGGGTLDLDNDGSNDDGDIDIDNSSLGSYIITWTTDTDTGSGGTRLCGDVHSVNLDIVSQSEPYFAYLDTTFCPFSPIMAVDTADSNGLTATWTSPTLVSGLNPGTGELDPAIMTPPGLHDIVMTTSGACAGDTTVQVRIRPLDDPTFTAVSSLCIHDVTSPPPTKTGGTSDGYFYLIDTLGGLYPTECDSTTGEIDMLLTGTGDFWLFYQTIDSCPTLDSTLITIFSDDPEFHYPDTSYCINDPSDPLPIILGNTGGRFSCDSAGFVIDSLNGRIVLDSLTAGIGFYNIRYITYGACSDTAIFTVEITGNDDPSFGYPQLSYCYEDSVADLNLLNDSTGTFREVTGYLQFTDSTISSTGQVDLQNTPAGVYLIYHRTANTCPDSTFTLLQIHPRQTATFAYSAGAYCQQDNPQRPTIFGTGGGYFTFTGTDTLDLDSLTGEVNPIGSGFGAFEVTYTTPGPCAVSYTDSLYIEQQANTNWQFQFGVDEFCQADTNPAPILDTLANNGGHWISNSSPQAVVDSVTGVVDLNATGPGTFSITYELDLGCISTTTRSFTILPTQDTTRFAYDSTFFCQVRGIEFPLLTGAGGGYYYVTQSDSNLVFTNFFAGNSLQSVDGGVDLWLSRPGTYTIYYNIPGACAEDTSFTMTIGAVDQPLFSYDTTDYCQNDIDPYPDTSGTPGIFRAIPDSVQWVASLFPGHIDLDATPSGTYTIEYYTTGACPDTIRQDVTINDVPQPLLITDRAGDEICNGDTINLEARFVNLLGNTFTYVVNGDYNNPASVVFEDNVFSYAGSSFPGRENLDTISVVVTDNGTGCADRDSLIVTTRPIPTGVVERVDTIISSDVPLEIDMRSDAPQTYFHWKMIGQGEMTPDSAQDIRGPVDSGVVATIFQQIGLESDFFPVSVTFYIQPEAYGCWGDTIHEVTINVNPNDEDIFVPGFMTPNGDGINDTWQIQVRTGVDPDSYQMVLLNRSGGVAHIMQPLNNNWAGGDLPEGVYWYVLKKADTGEIQKRGGLTIRRK